jgi:hypothetical protein
MVRPVPPGTNVRVRIAVLAVLAVAPASARAESPDGPTRVRLTGVVGYQITSDVNTAGGTIAIASAAAYGASVALALDQGYELELLWSISSTQARYTAYTAIAPSAAPNPLSINYFQVGVTKSIRSDIFETFGEATAGLVLLVPGLLHLTSGETLSVGNTWEFSFTLAAGVRIFLIEKLAIVVQARLLAPVYITSGGFYAGGGGAALVVGGGIPCVEGQFSAGLALAL